MASSSQRRVFTAAIHEPRTVIPAMQERGITPAAMPSSFYRRLFRAVYDVYADGEHVNAESVIQRAGLTGREATEALRLDNDPMPTDLREDMAQLVAAQQRVSIAALAEQLHAALGDNERPGNLLEEAADGLRRIQEVGERKTTGTLSMRDLAERSLEAQRTGEDGTVPTGIMQLDDAILGGVGAGEMMTIAAQSSRGKSILTLEALYRAAAQGHPALLYSYEDTQRMTFDRLICRQTGIRMEDLARCQVNEGHPQHGAYLAALADLERLPLYMHYAVGRTVAQLETDLWRMVDSHGVEIFAVDYIQQAATAGDEGKNIAVERAIEAVKRHAGRYNVAGVAVSQVRKEAGERPGLEDLYWSAAIRQASDKVLILWKKGETKPKTPLDVNVAKNKNGACYTGSDALRITVEWPRFRVLDP